MPVTGPENRTERNERSDRTAGDGGSEASVLSLSEGTGSGGRAVGIDKKRSGVELGLMGDKATMDAASSSECSSLSAAARCVFA